MLDTDTLARIVGRFTGIRFVAIEYAGTHIRRVRIDGNGRPYVRVCSQSVYLDGDGMKRHWNPVNFSTVS